MKNKELSLTLGILLHPFKRAIFYLSGGVSQYNILKRNAQYRAENKAFWRGMYIESLIHKSC